MHSSQNYGDDRPNPKFNGFAQAESQDKSFDQNSEQFQQLKNLSNQDESAKQKIENLVIHTNSEQIILEQQQSNSRNKGSSNHNDLHNQQNSSDSFLRAHHHQHNNQILKQSKMRLSQHFKESFVVGESRPQEHLQVQQKNQIDFANGSFQIQRIANTLSIEEQVRRIEKKQEGPKYSQNSHEEVRELVQNQNEQRSYQNSSSDREQNISRNHVTTINNQNKQYHNSDPYISNKKQTQVQLLLNINKKQLYNSSPNQNLYQQRQRVQFQPLNFQRPIPRQEPTVLQHNQSQSHQFIQGQQKSLQSSHRIIIPTFNKNVEHNNNLSYSNSQKSFTPIQNVNFHSPKAQFAPPRSFNQNNVFRQSIDSNTTKLGPFPLGVRSSFQSRNPSRLIEQPRQSFRLNSPQDNINNVRNSRMNILNRQQHNINRRSFSYHSSKQRKSISGPKPNVRFTYISNIQKQQNRNVSPPVLANINIRNVTPSMSPHIQTIQPNIEHHMQPGIIIQNQRIHNQQLNQEPSQPIINIIQQNRPSSDQTIKQQQLNWQECYHEILQKYQKLKQITKNMTTYIHQSQYLLSQQATAQQKTQFYKIITQKLHIIQQTIHQTHQQTTITNKYTSKSNDNTVYQKTIEQLTNRINRMQENNRELTNINEQLDTKIGRYSVEYANLDKQYHILENHLRNAQKFQEINRLQIKIEQIQAQKEQSIHQLVEKNRKLQKQIDSLVKINGNLELQLKKIQIQLKQCSQNIDSTDKQLINSQQTTINNLELHNSQLLQTNNLLLVNNSKLQQIIASQKQQISGLQQNLIQLKNSQKVDKIINVHQQQQSQQIKNMQQQLSQKNRQIAHYQQIIGDKERELQINSMTIKNINSNLDLVKQANASLSIQNKSQQQKLSSLLQQLNSYKADTSQQATLIQIKVQERLRTLQAQLINKHSQIPIKKPIRDRQQQFIDQYEKQIDRLKVQIRTRLQEKRKLEDDVFTIQENSKRKMMQKQSEIRFLNDKVKVTEDQLQRKIKDKDRKISSLQEEIQLVKKTARKSVTPKQVPSIVPPTNQHELKQIKQQYNQLQQEYSQLNHIKQDRQKKINANNQVIISLQEQNAKHKQQIMQLKRQSASMISLQNQVKILTQSLNKKSAELLQLKSISFQYNQLQVEVQTLKKQRSNLRQMLKLRSKQIEQLHNANHEMQMERSSNKDLLSRSYNRNIMVLSNKNMDDSEDYQVMTQSVRRKNDQIYKLKQTNQLKTTNIEQLQYEIEKMRNKLSFAERNLQHEKQESQEKIRYLQSRIKQLQQKAKSLDQSQRKTKTSYEQQIQNMEIAVKQKQQVIRKLDGQIKVHKIKLKGHDSKVQEYQEAIQNLNQKIKQLEGQKYQMKKQISDLQSSGNLDKNKLYDQYQIKIAELETAATVKDQKIKHLQNNIESLRLRISAADNPLKSQQQLLNLQQMEILKKKLADYQSRIFQQQSNKFGIAANFKTRDYQNAFIFEQKIIYDLKSQNQRLKLLLKDRNNGHSISQQTHQNYDSIQNRLLQFKDKLQNIIQANKDLQQLHHNTSQNFVRSAYRSPKNNIQYNKQYEILLRKHQQQIKQMQNWMTQLHRYCASLQEIRGSNNIHKQSYNRNIIINDKQMNNQQIKYYRQKNKQLEEMIDNHIKLNRQLKLKLEEYQSGSTNTNSITFYKQQLARYQKQLNEYEQKLRKLNEKNNCLQKQVNKLQSDDSAEMRLMQLQGIIQELNRKLASLQMQIELHNADYTKLQFQLQKAHQRIAQYQTIEQQKSRKINTLQRNLSRNEQQMQQNKKKYQNKALILQAEVQRLNQSIKKNSNISHEQITNMSTKISQLQQIIRDLEMQVEQYKNKIELLEDSDSQIKKVIDQKNHQIYKLEGTISTQQNKFKYYEQKIDALENQLQNLRNQNLRSIKTQKQNQSNYDQLLEKYNQLLRDNNQKISQLDHINSIIYSLRNQRQKEGDQSKKKLAYIVQMQQTIKKLKEEVYFYKEGHQNAHHQIQSLQSQISRLQKQIDRMRSVILQIQEQIIAYQGQKANLKYAIQYLRSNLLMIESLFDQLQTKGNVSQMNIIYKLKDSIQKGLQNCSEALAIL